MSDVLRRRDNAPDRSMTWSEAFLVSLLACIVAVPTCAGLYLVKSALGINLLPGPSPMHDMLFHLVR